jgi:hypothetical protein
MRALEQMEAMMLLKGRSEISVADLIRAGLLKPGQRLRHRKSGSVYATVTTEGHLRVRNKVYSSPSTAAQVASGGITNGWLSWFTEDTDDVLSLSELRQQLMATRRK